MELKIKVIGRNDLAVDFYCTCNNPKYKGTPLEDIMTTKISLYGYDDRNFFENVNKNKREFKCGVCKKEYTQQWFRTGIVQIEEVQN